MASGKATFLKFGLVGIVNTAVDFAVFVLLVRLFHQDVLTANVVAYLFAVTNSYILNRSWTFKAKALPGSWFKPYVRFVAVNSAGMFIGTVAVYLLASIMMPETAKLLSIAVTLVWNYFGTRYLVFQQGKHDA